MICEPMWHWKPDELEPGSARARAQRGGLVEVHAELVLAQPGGDVGVGAGVDVGVHAQGEAGEPRPARARAPASRASSSSLSALNSPMPALEREGDLGVALAHAGEDDAVGWKPARSAARELAARDDVGAGSRRARRRSSAEALLALTE